MRTLHIGISKSWLIHTLKRNDVKNVLPSFGGTTEEAILTVKKDPREYFDNCDCQKSPLGRCLGIKNEDRKT